MLMNDQNQNPINQTQGSAPATNLQPTPATTVTKPNPIATPPANSSPDGLTKASKLKRIFFQVLIGCLVASASIAVIAVLLGSFNDTLRRALATIAMVAIHAILSFSYISSSEQKDEKDGGRSIELFSNTVFVLIVLSFITSVFAIWELLTGKFTTQLYLGYGVLLFATLHADVLYRIRGFEKKIDTVITANYLSW